MAWLRYFLWSRVVVCFALGEGLLVLAFFLILDRGLPLRWTIALCPFAAGAWVLMRGVIDRLVPDAHLDATVFLKLTAALTFLMSGIAAGVLVLRGAGLV